MENVLKWNIASHNTPSPRLLEESFLHIHSILPCSSYRMYLIEQIKLVIFHFKDFKNISDMQMHLESTKNRTGEKDKWDLRDRLRTKHHRLL